MPDHSPNPPGEYVDLGQLVTTVRRCADLESRVTALEEQIARLQQRLGINLTKGGGHVSA